MSEFTRDLLDDIDATARDVFDLAARADAKEKAGSRRNAYERGLEEVEEVAGEPQARALAEWIREEMRERERFPSARDVRQQGAEICRESGHQVSTNDWLGA